MLADGIFYGTGTWSRYYEQSGPDLVKVSIKEGKISEVSNVKYTEDDSYQDKSFKSFDYLKGLEDVKELEKNQKEKKGEAHDGVASATQSALGEVIAVDNALARSRKLKKDGKEQKIAYLDFTRKPNARAVGDSLDISDTILDLHFADGSRKDVPFADFANYGITVDKKQGSPLPELGTTFPVYFQKNPALLIGEAENENEKPVKVELRYIPDKREKKVSGEGNSENGDGEEEKHATVEISFPNLVIKGKTAKVILHLHYISIEEKGEDGAAETE